MNNQRWVKIAALMAAVGIGAGVGTSAFASLTFEGSLGGLSASVTFEVSGDDLITTLANTSASDVLAPGSVLTGVFFDAVPPDMVLTRVSAVLGPGSAVLFGTTDPGGVVGGEWAYRNGLTGAPGSAGFGLSSAGLGLFSPSDNFPGSNLQGPASVDGLQYGITSAGDDAATGNAAVTGGNALIQNSVILTLTGLPADFDINSIHNVTFQYGTALTGTQIGVAGYAGYAPVPEPTTMIAGALLLLPFGASTLRFLRRRAKT